MKEIKKFFSAPVFTDETLSRRAQLLSFIINLHLVIAGAIAVLYLSVFSGDAIFSLAALATCIPALGMRVVLHRGRVSLAATLFIGFIALTMPLVAVIGKSSIASVSITAFQFITIVMAGLLLGGRGAMGFLIFTTVLNGVVLYAEAHAWYLATATLGHVEAWIIQVITYIAVAVLLWLANRLIRDSLAHAQQETEERRAAEASLQLAVDAAHLGTWTTDIATGKSVFSSRMIAIHGGQVPDPAFSAIYPEDRERVRQAVASIQSGQQERYTITHRIVLPDGSERWLDSYGLLSRDRAGKPGRVAGVVMDITERKQAEEKIQQRLTELVTVNAVSQVAASQLELNTLIEVTGEKLRKIQNVDSLYIALYDSQSQLISFQYWRSHGRIVQAPQLTLGQGLTSWVITNRKPLIILQDFEQRGNELGVVHRNFSGLPDTRPRSWIGLPMQVGEQVIGVLSIQNFEKEFAFSEDDIRLWETIAANIGVAIQNAQLYTAAQQELTERKQLIAELEAKNAELERFTYTVSHDLKSPIITIGGFLGYLERDALAGDTERLRNDIARIQNATSKMKTLLDELLELSRIGRMMNPPEDVSFEDIVQQSLELASGRLDARHVRVTVAGNLPVVHGDRARLIEVMQNLIDNAAKFMGDDQPEPHIEIGQLGEENGKPVFYVRDNGIGISPEFHEKIFGLFNKLDPNVEGTGVGLALAKRIVEFHGGRIWVESELGKGTTFYFTLNHSHNDS